MNKSDLIDSMAKAAGITKVQAAASLDAFMLSTQGALKKNDKVILVGFGTFSVTKRAARKGRNPATGAEIKIAASKTVKFTAGKAFKDAVNKRK
jgi:DNA-binding protein HU-beta